MLSLHTKKYTEVTKLGSDGYTLKQVWVWLKEANKMVFLPSVEKLHKTNLQTP